MNDTKGAALKTQRVISTIILVYFILCLVGFLSVIEVFGIGPAIGLSLVLAFPLAIGVRMRSTCGSLRSREFIYLCILIAVALVAAGSLVGIWFSMGMERVHAQDLEYGEFQRVLRNDSAFHRVTLFRNEKGIVYVSGTVGSEAELKRLRSLAAQYKSMNWIDEVGVK